MLQIKTITLNNFIADFSEEAQSLCTELESCISLLLPTPEDFFLPMESDTAASSSSDQSLRVHGIVSAGISIPIQLNNSILSSLCFFLYSDLILLKSRP
jgi:hypothetical protein